jgi:serine-type D-Ala-D-Ala carboxypeptidase/endopeptidase (penicillin-binding protein 4)
MRSILYLTLIFVSISANAKSLTQIIQSDKQFINFNLSYIIADSNGNVLAQQNNNKFVCPASITKIFTATSAILSLGPNYQFKTTLYKTGTIKKHTLEGNLYIKFTGDPSLTQQNLTELISNLKQLGITTISGKVYFVANTFNNQPYADGTTVDDLSYDYASPISSVIINANSFGIRLNIDPNKTPHASVTQFNSPATLSSKIKLGNSSTCKMNIISNMDNHYILQGCGIKRKEAYIEHFKLAIRNTIKAAPYFIKKAFSANKIQIKSSPKLAYLNSNATPLATHRPPKLNVLVHKMLKESNNIIANSLLKTMGHKYSKSQGSWENGVAAIKHTLDKKLAIKPDQIKLEDGAGLSRYNLVTAHATFQLLRAIQKNPVLRKYIIPALPIAGKDGTLTYRLTKLDNGVTFKAKTGSMTGVSNLAGYMQIGKQKNLIIVLMSDRFSSKVKLVRKWEDNIIRQIARSG